MTIIFLLYVFQTKGTRYVLAMDQKMTDVMHTGLAQIMAALHDYSEGGGDCDEAMLVVSVVLSQMKQSA